MADASVGKLDIGKVVSGVFRVIRANPRSFALTILALVALPSVVLGMTEVASGTTQEVSPSIRSIGWC